jgi:1-acyl-sn-glycerol-3-phosphate acyltransferase
MSEQADPGGSSAVRRGTTIVLPPVIKAVMKRDWHGREHIPRDGGVIIAPNHLSYADWAAVALFTYQAGRYPFFLIKSSAFDVKLLGPFLRACGQLPVHRDRGDATLVVKELKDAETAPSGSQVTEGVKSAGPVLELARAHGVEMPITEVVAGVTQGRIGMAEAVMLLASRSAKPERYGV